MRFLIELTYFRPHTSGLTIYAERLGKALVKRGHQVTVLTSQYQRQLPLEEEMDGMRVVRVPVAFRISKGVVMPQFGFIAQKLVMESDVISLHLPQLDAAGLAIRGRLFKKPTIITYHCDLKMPPGFISRAANLGVRVMNNLAAFFTHSIVAYTQDYVDHSNYLRRYAKKIRIISPPVILPPASAAKIKEFRQLHNPQGRGPIIGIAARFASEKGIDILLNSLDAIIKEYPSVQVWFAGPFKGIIGEEHYFQQLTPMINKYIENGTWKFLGSLSPEEMSAYYPNLDLLVLPSLNSTESFGLVQIEAMMNGIPVVASDLPGVRQPILRHKFGKTFPQGNPAALAEAVMEVLEKKLKGKNDQGELINAYSPDSVAQAYEKLAIEINNTIHTSG
jgi:glycosyltransferase involved in cell wall biosynthesis